MVLILVVEDDESTRHGLCGALRQMQYDVQEAASLSDAIQLASAMSFDLILSDIDLPDGTGWELARVLLARARIPAIAMSGSDSPDDIRNSLSAGFLTHLNKPLRVGTLLNAVQGALAVA